MAFENRGRPFVVERRDNGTKRTPLKPKAWNHQDELRSYRGRNVRVVFMDQDPVEGVLLEADQFTIKMHTKQHDLDMIFFKSALVGFYPVPAVTTE
jgi:hypothetical protein